MSVHMLAASLIAAGNLAQAPEATAADLGPGYEQRYSEDYEDPPPPRGHAGDYNGEEQYEDNRSHAWRERDDDDDAGEDEVLRHRRWYKDGDYLDPLPRAPRFDDRLRRERYACAVPWQIKKRLRHEGWTDFHDLDFEGDTAVVRATRIRSGRTFTLRVVRCTGEVVSAQPLRWQSYGAYAPPHYRSPY